ncbi:hypothetical protein JZU68_04130, partial [bacterium]|nr:hypothetical protein [bacterium]
MKKYFVLLISLHFSYCSLAQFYNADLIIKNINIVDVANNTILREQTVVISKDKIVATGYSKKLKWRY